MSGQSGQLSDSPFFCTENEFFPHCRRRLWQKKKRPRVFFLSISLSAFSSSSILYSFHCIQGIHTLLVAEKRGKVHLQVSFVPTASFKGEKWGARHRKRKTEMLPGKKERWKNVLQTFFDGNKGTWHFFSGIKQTLDFSLLEVHVRS